METKESLIEKIDFCETVLKTMIELEDNIKKLKEKELELQKEHKDIVDEGPWDLGTLIFYCVFVGLLCAGVGLIATVIIGLFTASWKSFINLRCSCTWCYGNDLASERCNRKE